MQTFLPLPSFAESAAVLDRQRLGKQRVEAKQILMGLLQIDKDGVPLELSGNPDTSARIMTHPAAKMWYGYEMGLAVYTHLMCDEWVMRGYQSNVQEWVRAAIRMRGLTHVEMPPWRNDPAVYRSHQAVLLAKDPAHYSRFGWDVAPAIMTKGQPMPYVWPVSDRARITAW
jgi:hypothetical protein